ncbi:Predicted O-methyltransferase YrrM [Tistlia consotensis]|uniref:Predicted O-methyltransferase YrrM n=1 Tax=Tistlia consotensis USBA 355 TaxID=560819 RepID=A0A1Y6CSX0_9PROT|nr:class I SAM-dependent methyltransferase [Tistlia consotensis]SMF77038.1 Predicted O-methyltransferase YrrM [Tistlia consotensis USBA 355]SNS13930.1 Predicted O-methyltransferase YrrM [Tistlia consotensis]
MITALPRRYRAWQRRRVLRQARRSELGRLRALGHPLANALADAIGGAAEPAQTRDERQAIERIERLRRDLAASDETIEHLDFGAGDASAPRARSEARRGVPVTMPVSRLATSTSKGQPWSGLIFNLVRALRPDRCLEMGTCLGLSAAYQCAALAQNGSGRLVTLEGGPAYAAKARQNLAGLGFDNFDIVVGPFEVTLGPTLEKERPIDFLFNDGHHDGDALLDYFEGTLPYLAEGSVLLVDDIAVYQSMRRGWRRLVEHPAVDLSVDLGAMGLVCVNPRPLHKAAFTVPLA